MRCCCCHHSGADSEISSPPERKQMRHLVFAVALLGATAAGAQAQTAIPDLKGTWSGKGKSIVFGSHAHHPGSQTPNDPRYRGDLCGGGSGRPPCLGPLGIGG